MSLLDIRLRRLKPEEEDQFNDNQPFDLSIFSDRQLGMQREAEMRPSNIEKVGKELLRSPLSPAGLPIQALEVFKKYINPLLWAATVMHSPVGSPMFNELENGEYVPLEKPRKITEEDKRAAEGMVMTRMAELLVYRGGMAIASKYVAPHIKPLYYRLARKTTGGKVPKEMIDKMWDTLASGGQLTDEQMKVYNAMIKTAEKTGQPVGKYFGEARRTGVTKLLGTKDVAKPVAGAIEYQPPYRPDWKPYQRPPTPPPESPPPVGAKPSPKPPFTITPAQERGLIAGKPKGAIIKTPETGEVSLIDIAYPELKKDMPYSSYFSSKVSKYEPLKVGLAGGMPESTIGGEVGLGGLPQRPPGWEGKEVPLEAKKPTALIGPAERAKLIAPGAKPALREPALVTEPPRPVKIDGEKVITPITENKIARLKDHYMQRGELTEDAYNKILEQSGLVDKTTGQLRQPTYVDSKNWVSEDDAREVIRAMHRAAPTIRLVNTMNEAIKANPEIGGVVNKINRTAYKPGRSPMKAPHSLESMRYYMQRLDEITGAPIYLSYLDLIESHNNIRGLHDSLFGRLLKSTPQSSKIVRDETALQRVSDYIASKGTSPMRPHEPKDITPDERAFAGEMANILDEYKVKARLAKFMDYYETGQKRYLPDYKKYAKDIERAVEIYDTEGVEALKEYLATQEWGVIKGGYEPHEMVVNPPPSTYRLPPSATGTGHIKVRNEIFYKPQARNILQRFNAYVKQMDNLTELRGKINSFVGLFDDTAMAKFTDKKAARRVADEVTIFLDELKGFGYPRGFFDRMISRLYAQAMKTIILPSPILSFRNTMQNPAFSPDKSILFNPRNKTLTPDEVAYVEQHVLQTKPMMEDWFMSYQKALPGLGGLTSLVEKVKLYPLSDIANRYWAFWAKINQLKRVWGSDLSLEQKLNKVGIKSLRSLEQKTALGILARDGEDAFFKYVAKSYTDDQNFLYERAQRSPAEMGPMGRVVGNLALFPRAYWERMIHAGKQVIKGGDAKTKWRGLKLIFATITGGMLMDYVHNKVTGRRRGPYNPFNLARFRPGGLMWETLDRGAETMNMVVSALSGDEKALYGATTAIPQLNDMFIPFYAYVLRGLEATTDTKNLDRLVLRKLLEAVDKEYKVRGGAYKVDRDALKAWQYFLGGRQIDYKEEAEKTLQKTRKSLMDIRRKRGG